MRLPPIRSLEAMVAVARLGSLAAAAEEIGMSVPALSRRMALLEEEIGERLFDRLPRGVALTVAGTKYHATVIRALQMLRDAQAAVRGGSDDKVKVTTIPAFATRWLLPRLPGFAASHPDIEVDVRTSLSFEDLEGTETDFAIRLSTSASGNGHLLLPIDLVPVWSADHLGDLRSVEAVLDHMLLSPDHRPEFWDEWLAAHDVPPDRARRRDVDALLLYEMALGGAGVAIGIGPLAGDLLARRRLSAMCGDRIRSGRSFYLHARLSPPSRAVRLFGAWLLQQAGDPEAV